MGKKKVKAVVKLELEAGKATPAPPVGPVLGQHGINIVEFVKAYNDRTASQAGMIIPAEITIYEDRTFTFITKMPPAAYLIKKAAGIEKGAARPGRERAGVITLEQAREIARQKMPDLNTNNLDEAVRMIVGTARSMGVFVEGWKG
jgi:large subunit ribosomal protein L11